MKADPSVLLRLLDVQERDSRIDALRHQLSSLPEIDRLADATVRRTEHHNRARDLQIQVDDLSRAQRKADADVEQVKTRRERDRSRMDQGLITNPKDLERMSHELDSLERRITTLEDEELEVMEQLETAQQELGEAQAAVAAADEETGTLTTARDEKSAALQQQIDTVTAEREQLVLDIPADLLALYERLRANKGGVGAAPLLRRQCTGCRLTLDASEIVSLTRAPDDEVLRCEECQRILVRTPESGL